MNRVLLYSLVASIESNSKVQHIQGSIEQVAQANLVIELKPDGTYSIVKSREFTP